jgi:DNA-binding transcriptional MerR regulator
MQIGEVAARTELSLRTIRHYEDAGLVSPSARSQGASASTPRPTSPV